MRIALLLLLPLLAHAAEVTLTCDMPTENEDGTPLTDLAGIKFYESASSGGPYTEIGDEQVCSLTLDRGPGTYYFVATAYNTAGTESRLSNEAEKIVISAPNPPTNLVTGGNLVAYTIQQVPNVILTYPIGTVPAGVPCDPDQSVNGFHRVDIELVTMPEGVEARVAVAECVAG